MTLLGHPRVLKLLGLFRRDRFFRCHFRFDRDRPFTDGEHVDLEVRRGWIRLYDWEGKGLIREFEKRGIEPEFGSGG